MISPSAVCLDRRVANPPASESGGFTIWTLPYPVATDGSEGRVAVALLDTGQEVAAIRPSATTVAAAGSYSARPVVVGIAYTWRYVPTTIYASDSSGKPDRRAAVRLSYVRAFFNDTRAVIGKVTVPGRAVCQVALTEATPSEGQTLTLPVFSDSRRAALELSSDSPFPVRIGSMEWDGQFDPHTVTQVP